MFFVQICILICSSLLYVDLEITNQWGSTLRPWLKMQEGWMALLPQDSAPNLLAFQSVEHVTNISYQFEVYGMHQGENFMILGHDLYQVQSTLQKYFAARRNYLSVIVPIPNLKRF